MVMSTKATPFLLPDLGKGSNREYSRLCRIRSSVYKVGNRLCEKNLHFYFNFAVPTPYSHGVRRQQADRMFPCKEKNLSVTKRRMCYEKDFVSEKTDRYGRHAGHDLFYPQIGVGKRLDGGRRRVKKYLWSF